MVLLYQLDVRLGIHMRDHVVKILKVSTADFCKRGRMLLQGSRQKLKKVAKYNVWPTLDLKILFHVFLTDHFDLAVRSLPELTTKVL